MKKKNNVETASLISDVLLQYTRHWKWFILSLTLSLIIALGLIITTSKQYRPILSILLNEDQTSKNTSSGNINLESIGIYNFINNIDNEIVILSSPDLMKTVVKSLNLNVSYFKKNIFRYDEIYKKSPFLVTSDKFDLFDQECEFSIQKISSGYNIDGVYKKGKEETKFDLLIQNLPYKLILGDDVTLNIDISNDDIDEDKYYIKVDNIETTTYDLASKLSVSSVSAKSSVLNLSILVNNMSKGIDILNELVNKYNEENSILNSKIAINTSQFINDRLREISAELSIAEKEVVDYKQANNIADLDSEAQMLVSQTGENDKNLMEAETQLNVLNYIKEFIDNPHNKNKIIPNMDISDVGLSLIIQEYNNKLLTSDQLLQVTGEKNPARIRVINELDNMISEISGSLANVKETYVVAKKDLLQRSYETQSNIRSVPKQEKGLIEKVREQKIKENLFIYLMQKREETNLSIAAISEKARIISSPTSKLTPIAPRKKILLLEFAIIGILIPIVIIYIKILFKTKISNRHEFEQLSNIPIIGEISINDSNSYIVEQQKTIAELFRTLRNNIKFISPKSDGLSILVTSTIANEGKTFIGINLALSFAYTNKNVLFIGGDLRTPSKNEFKEKKGLSDYLLAENFDWMNLLLTPYQDLKNFQVLPPGILATNPNELLLNFKLKELLDKAKKEYDYIIIDSAPIGIVSDSYIIGEHTDLTLYVVRENKTPKDAINFINTQQAENKLQNIYIVINGIERRNDYRYKSK